MKEIQVEQKSYKTFYETADGERFSIKEEAKKYEESAKCMLFAKLKTIVIEETNAEDVFTFGNPDEKVYLVRVDDEKKLDLLLQIRAFVNDDYCGDVFTKRLQTALEKKSIVPICTGWEGDDFYTPGCVDEIVERFRSKLESYETKSNS